MVLQLNGTRGVYLVFQQHIQYDFKQFCEGGKRRSKKSGVYTFFSTMNFSQVMPVKFWGIKACCVVIYSSILNGLVWKFNSTMRFYANFWKHIRNILQYIHHFIHIFYMPPVQQTTCYWSEKPRHGDLICAKQDRQYRDVSEGVCNVGNIYSENLYNDRF